MTELILIQTFSSPRVARSSTWGPRPDLETSLTCGCTPWPRALKNSISSRAKVASRRRQSPNFGRDGRGQHGLQCDGPSSKPHAPGEARTARSGSWGLRCERPHWPEPSPRAVMRVRFGQMLRGDDSDRSPHSVRPRRRNPSRGRIDGSDLARRSDNSEPHCRERTAFSMAANQCRR
jgi:hypothetical protein